MPLKEMQNYFYTLIDKINFETSRHSFLSGKLVFQLIIYGDISFHLYLPN